MRAGSVLYMVMRYAVLLPLWLCAAFASGETLVERGYSEMYNLEFEQAHRTFAQYETVQPKDPLGPVSDAAACLFSEFDRLHILQSEFFLDDRNVSREAAPLHADPVIRARFETDLAKAEQLAAPELRLPDQRANALFAETMRLGLHADYVALIDKRELAALSDVKEASAVSQELLSVEPHYYDAYIATGVENYLLSLKSAPVRWVLRMSGAATDKQVGLSKLRLTAEHGHYLLPYARLLLAVAALREGDRRKACELLAWLSDRYPQNTLYKRELTKLQ